jgi:hypothetical protein
MSRLPGDRRTHASRRLFYLSLGVAPRELRSALGLGSRGKWVLTPVLHEQSARVCAMRLALQS